MFLFNGGALDGTGLWYDSEETYSGDFGAKAFADTDGGLLGKQFEILSPDPVEPRPGTKVWRRYIYETVSKDFAADGTARIQTKFIRRAD